MLEIFPEVPLEIWCVEPTHQNYYVGARQEFSFRKETYQQYYGGSLVDYDSLTIYGGATDKIARFLYYPTSGTAGIHFFWPTTESFRAPANPADTNLYGLAIFGDILAGGHATWTEAIPGSGTFSGTIFGRRVGNNITSPGSTSVYSHKGANEDETGGAFITLYPDYSDGAVDSGALVLVAFGRGTGTAGNSILLQTRSAANTASTRWRVESAGDLKANPGMSLRNVNYLEVDEITTPAALADHAKIYAKNDNKLYFQDGAGNEHEVAFA